MRAGDGASLAVTLGRADDGRTDDRRTDADAHLDGPTDDTGGVRLDHDHADDESRQHAADRMPDTDGRLPDRESAGGRDPRRA